MKHDEEKGVGSLFGQLSSKKTPEPFFLPAPVTRILIGGSTAHGALGYVGALFELLDQVSEGGVRVDALVVPIGSAGTVAGILAGLAVVEKAIPVVAVAIMGAAPDREALARELTGQVLGLLGRPAGAACEGLSVTDRTVGPGYGIPTDEVIDAVKRAAQLEGLLLDPVYTGKAMAALFDLVRRGRFNTADQVVFWHTGGAPALFAYRDVL
jgi:1-aminocyclopropane-1-carboxylate deaminase/D-cysteine desulfhydrase-like pyridoxal-dependent ACC family enzyme